MNFSAVLDGASKAAAGVGVILGMSYVSGLFKIAGFYREFHAEWLFEAMDVQAYISEGLPVTSLLVLIFATHFFGLSKVKDRHRPFFMLSVVVLTSLVGFLISFFFYPSLSLYISGGTMVGLAGAAFAAWISHSHFYPSRSAVDLYHLILALVLMLSIGPYLVGQGRADDIFNAREETTEIIDSRNKVVGVLVRIVSGKYLAVDCNVRGQLSFYEISPAYRLRRSSGYCKAAF
ncbi:hypothetical protein ACF8SB_02970 [Pseudomonas sp. CJQ_8]|uniref:hypothetical protein n=1 Tax=Pseudomonas sp. CJQ_8 TaxID=3367167 RepID=UPI00370BEEE0